MNTVAVTHEIYGRLEATWERKGRMIVIRFGEREKKEVASDDDAVNKFVALDVLRRWVAEDLKD
jgi:hypothetical protein